MKKLNQLESRIGFYIKTLTVDQEYDILLKNGNAIIVQRKEDGWCVFFRNQSKIRYSLGKFATTSYYRMFNFISEYIR